MKHHDGLIQPEDLKAVRRKMKEEGWGDFALNIFEYEPLLGECLAGRWANIRLLLSGLGLAQDDIRPVLRQVLMMAVESLGLQQRAKHKLLADLLPDLGDGGGHA